MWLTIPSAKPNPAAQKCVDLWRSRGYRVALWRDSEAARVDCDLLLIGKYPGYARSCNALIGELLTAAPDAQWFICAGDDIEPDMNHTADEIAAQCFEHFGGSFGVMQPTGDRWGEDPTLPNLHPLRTAYIDRVAASAWYGREYCQRMYGGNGPLFDGYFHMFVDEEAKAVAELMGVYWMRPDITQMHQHWGRTSQAMPSYLARVNGPAHWQEASTLFESRKALGFPGFEPKQTVAA